MKIVCLIKQVPRTDAIAFDPDTKSLKREGVPLLLNPFDAGAVAHAVGLKERHGGEVIAMTMGPPQASEALQTCLALGADRCIHLSDRAFAVADTLGTSRTLALAIQKESDVDLVVCGRKTTDSETWQVPPEVAAFLRVPHLTSVVESEFVGGRLHATRESDDGGETWSITLPAVISCARARDAAETADGRIDVWTAADLVDDVRPNDKRFGQTGSPTRVLAVRDVTPERSGETFDTPAYAAARVRVLLAERRLDPSDWTKPERLGDEPSANRYDCWTLVEHSGGRIARVSLELLGKGRELAGKLGGECVALVLGHEIGEVAREAGRYGADRVVVAEHASLATYHPEIWGKALTRIVREHRPHVLLIPSTANGRDVGPRVAGDLELGMTGDCVGLGIDRAGRLIQTKPAYGGNIVSVIMGATTPQLATVRARMFEPLEPRGDGVPIERVELGGLEARTLELLRRTDSSARDLDAADIVVCLGPELDSSEVAEARAIAESSGAALGATLEVCERGDLPRNRQLGLLGRAIAPALLVTVGVPGGFEQLTGFVKAGVIAALNGERGAAMLDAADVGVVGDWRDALTELVRAGT